MELLNKHPSTLADYIATRLINEKFNLVDIGCSGGIDDAWRVFGNRLSAIGIDPNRSEIKRLTQAENNAEVRYFAAFAGLPDGHPIREFHARFSGLRRNPWANLSVHCASELRKGRDTCIPAETQDLRDFERRELKLLNEIDNATYVSPETGHDYAATEGINLITDLTNQPNAATERKLAEENLWPQSDLVDSSIRINVADLLDYLHVKSVDFIKIDVDGSDYEVLYSLQSKLNELSVLGACLEVNFIGSESPHHHTFHNTDRLMRKAGFGLFGLTTRSYSSSSLPAPFLYPFPAQSVIGRPMQGDALYLRDFAFRTESANPDAYSAEKLAKLIALFALFDLPDHAAETTLRFRNRLEGTIEIEKVLDMLTSQMRARCGIQYESRDYRSYMDAFFREDSWFFNHQQRS